jgi:osmoprotectant transport system permease protein
LKVLSAHTLTVLFLYIVSVCTPLFFPEQGHTQNRAEKNQITVGSKAFTEGYILAEIVAQVLEATGETKVVRKFGIGGTGLLYEALVNGSIDVYPEYSGTISEAILKDSTIKNLRAMRASLSRINLILSEPLGFNNTHALANA